MQIREKGQKVLLIRTEYCKDKKRTFGRTVASQNKYLSTVSEEVSRQLTKAEVDKLKAWLSRREKKRAHDGAYISLALLNRSLKDATKSLSVDGAMDGLPESWGNDTLDSIDELKKALRKQGIRNSRQTKTKPVDAKKTNPMQLHIED